MDGQQLGIDLWPRTHDLPPRWDGLPVQWSQWSTTDGIRLCGRASRSEDRCSRCSSTAAPRINLGRVWADPASAEPAIGPTRSPQDRRPAYMITAFRCPACQHDWVLDGNADTWDLDPTDYTDRGSWP